MRILLVEDDKSIISNLTQFLAAEGYEVKSASGQTKALSMMEKERFIRLSVYPELLTMMDQQTPNRRSCPKK